MSTSTRISARPPYDVVKEELDVRGPWCDEAGDAELGDADHLVANGVAVSFSYEQYMDN